MGTWDRLRTGRTLILAITCGVLAIIGFIWMVVFYIVAAADYEFDSNAVEDRRALVEDVINRSLLVWLLPGGIALLLLWRLETRFVPAWLVFLAMFGAYGVLGYALFAGIWPRFP
jgi:hypothetical protein